MQTPSPGAQVQPLLQQAMAQLNRGAFPQAEALAVRALALGPEDADALQFMGMIRQMQGRVREAEELYRRALAIAPTRLTAHFNLGLLLYHDARYDEALAEFEEMSRLKPDEADAFVMCGQCHKAKDNLALAEKAFRQALRVQPNSLNARQSLGELLIDQGNGAEAETVLREALAMNPRDPRQRATLQKFLGSALQKQRRYPEAFASFDAAAAAQPATPMLDYCRGLTLHDMGDLEGAIASYRKAVARDPLDVQAHRELNCLLYRLGRDGEFLQSLDEAAKLHSGSGKLPLLKGNLLFMIERDDEAADVLEDAVRKTPASGVAHDMLGVIHARQGRFGDAVKAHERATAVDPDNALFWTNFGRTLLQAADPEQAREACERALAIKPELQSALATWGVVLRVLGDGCEEYLNDYERLVQVFDLPPPEGYDDMDAFNRDLNAYLDPMHHDKREPLEQTLRKGSRTYERLIGRGHEPVEKLRARIDDAVCAYVERMKEDGEHPLYRRRTRSTRYAGSWSTRLSDCGFYTNHVHPNGWISSCYYVAVPDVAADEANKQGWIKFGEPGFETGIADPIRRMVQPKPGRLVLFPSYMWHGTVPFHSGQARTTIAFDAVPV